MMKKKQGWIGILAAVLLVLNLFLPTGYSYAAGTEYTVETAREKGILPEDTTKPSFVIRQNGFEIKPGSNINVNEALDIVIKDLELVLFDNVSGMHLVEPGDSLKVYFDKNLKLKEASSTSKPIGEVATLTYGEDANGIYARITFTGTPDEMEQTGSISTDISTKMELSDDSTGELELWGNKYMKVKLPPVREYEGEKTGKVDIVTQTAAWTVDISAKRKSDGEATSLAGSTFSDVLDGTTAGTYRDGSFMIKLNTEAEAQPVAPNYSGNVLSYTFPDDTTATSATVTFVTDVPDSQFFTHNEEGADYNGENRYNDIIIKNTAAVYEGAEKKLEIKGEAKFQPIWISKYGDSHRNGFDEAASIVLHITWYITVNQEKITMTDAKVTEKWPDKLTFVKSVIQEKDPVGEWQDIPATEATTFSPVFELGTIRSERRIKILATGPVGSEQAPYKNTAELSFSENESKPISSTDVAHAGLNMLSKRPDRSKDPSNALEWKNDGLYANWEVLVHGAEGKLNPNQNNKVFDIFYYEHSLTGDSSMKKKALDLTASDLTFSPELPSELKGRTERLRGLSTPDYQAIGHQLVEGDYTYFSSLALHVDYLTPTVYKIYRGGVEIGQILEVKGFQSLNDWQGIRFQTKIVDPSMLFPNERVVYNADGKPVPNERVIVRNTALLFDNDVQLNHSSNRHNNDNTTLYKEAIPYSAVQAGDYHNKHAASKSAAQAAAFNPQDGTVTFRLSVNGSGRNISGTTVWNGTENVPLGKISVVDHLPKGWQLAEMEDGKKFHLYEGKPAVSDSGAVNPMYIDALGKIGDPQAYVTLSETGSFDEPKLSFEFGSLDAPYVILFKAKPSVEIMQDYQNKIKTNAEGYVQYPNDSIAIDTNRVTMESDNWAADKRITDKQNIEIPRNILSKVFVKNTAESTIKWTIEYKGRNAEQLKGTDKIMLTDRLDSALELPINDKGEIDPSAITIAEHMLTKDGRFVNPGTVLSDNEKMRHIAYNMEDRVLTFTVPDSAKNYSFSYDTVIVEEKEVINRVEFVSESGAAPVPVQATVRIADADLNSTIKKLGAVYIEKKGKESVTAADSVPLESVTFEVYTTSGKRIRSGVTDHEGKAFLGWYMPGTYILKEKKVDGYQAISDKTIVLSKDAEGKVIVKQGATEITKTSPLEIINIRSSAENPSGGTSTTTTGTSPGGGTGSTTPPTATTPTTPIEVIPDETIPGAGLDSNASSSGSADPVNKNSKNPQNADKNIKIENAPKTGVGKIGMLHNVFVMGASGILTLLITEEVLVNRKRKNR